MNFLIFGSGDNCNWEVMEARADKVEKMTKDDVLQLRCGNAEKYDKGKTIKEVFDNGRQQLLEYVHNLRKNDNQNHCKFATTGFVLMTVGSRKLLWEKVEYY